ncbi:MAG: hypothetical protein Q8903_12295, partial [Bacteroidota bacterium]|nr:hypothetical protein [Bacteroidota bacterium]
MKRYILYSLALLFAFSSISCSVFNTISNLTRLKFKLADVNNFTLNGIPISNKAKVTDFGALDIIKFTTGVAQGKMQANFTLNIQALNPNDGTGGYPRTNISMVSFPWRLFIDGKETITGNISSPVYIPGTGESVTFPISIGMNLMDFFKNNEYQSIVNLALALGGSKSSSARITIYARPTISTSLGNIAYPEE